MKVEEIRNLQIDLSNIQIRAGKALTTIQLNLNGKCSGRDIVIRNEPELEELIEGLVKVREFLKTL